MSILPARSVSSEKKGNHIRDLWKRVLTLSSMHFDPSVDYKIYQSKFHQEFEKNWEIQEPSPNTGLKGFANTGTLGSGSFGNVFLVQSEITSEYYAVKVFSKKKVVESKQVKNIFNEKRVLSSIKFPFHTSLEFSRKDSSFLYLGMTLVEGGELFFYLRKVECLNENEACFYAAQIFLALEYLHNLNLVYRDLKPENICIDSKGYVKMTDYGFTKYVKSRTLTLVGTPEYLPPEVITMKPYKTSVDWWAFGVLIYELVAGYSPFSDYAKTPMLMYGKICEALYKIPPKFSSSLKNLINRLLQPEISKRIGVCEQGSCSIREHIWFKKIVWYNILNQTIKPPYIPEKNVSRSPMTEIKILQLYPETSLYDEFFETF